MIFTFVLQHKNTTCIRQADGDSIKEAIENWIPMLEGVPFGKDEVKSSLNIEYVREEIKDTKLVPLRNLRNVWCLYMRFDTREALLNVIMMDSSNEYDIA